MSRMHERVEQWRRADDEVRKNLPPGVKLVRTLVLGLSTAALESDWVMLERSSVPFLDPSNVGGRSIPLSLTDWILSADEYSPKRFLAAVGETVSTNSQCE
jgi:hypothetical protein